MTVTKAQSPVIQVTDIVKHYGSVITLNNASTHVSAGEVLCLLGDNLWRNIPYLAPMVPAKLRKVVLTCAATARPTSRAA